MTLIRRRTEIIVETREVLVVRPAGGGARGRCDACGGPARGHAPPAPNRARAWRLCAALCAWLVSTRAGTRRQPRPSESA